MAYMKSSCSIYAKLVTFTDLIVDVLFLLEKNPISPKISPSYIIIKLLNNIIYI